MEQVIDLKTPLTSEDVEPLRAGDRVTISGTIYTARDAAHRRLIDLLDEGKELPFPILLDATGESLRRFSIKALGTHVLIDPDGKVAKGGMKTLEAGLREMIEESAGNSRKNKDE